MKDIQYDTFKIQSYMKSHILTNHEVSLLFSLRSRTFRGVKNNFGMKDRCSLGCPTLEDQEHWLMCGKTTFNINTDIQYSQLYGTLEQKINIVKLISLFEDKRKDLAERSTPSSPVAADICPRPYQGL